MSIVRYCLFSVLSVIFEMNLVRCFALSFFPALVEEETFGDKWHRLVD